MYIFCENIVFTFQGKKNNFFLGSTELSAFVIKYLSLGILSHKLLPISYSIRAKLFTGLHLTLWATLYFVEHKWLSLRILKSLNLQKPLWFVIFFIFYSLCYILFENIWLYNESVKTLQHCATNNLFSQRHFLTYFTIL